MSDSIETRWLELMREMADRHPMAIVHAVSAASALTSARVMGRQRDRMTGWARTLAISEIRFQFPEMTQQEIATLFGHSDHGSVQSSHARVRHAAATHQAFRELRDRFSGELKHRGFMPY